MRYFIPVSERQGSCYFEFQPGRWRGRFWLPDSILLADERAVIDEAAPWAEASFARHGVISILGL